MYRGLWVFGVGLSIDKQMIQPIAPGLSCPDKLFNYKVKTAPWEKVLIPSQTKHSPNPTISFSHHLIILRNMITLMFPKHSYLCDQQQIYDNFLKIKALKPCVACAKHESIFSGAHFCHNDKQLSELSVHAVTGRPNKDKQWEWRAVSLPLSAAEDVCCLLV